MDDEEAVRQISVLRELWEAVSVGEQFESDHDLLVAAGEDYHFREPDYGKGKEE
jgi:hypothetical protein